MKRYNLFQAIFMSFYSKNLYRDVAINWGGRAFLYLLMLVALSWIVATYQIQHVLNQGYHQDADQVVAQIPVLTIKEGKISTPENRPYIITDPDTNHKIAVIDTSGQYTTLDQSKTDILVTQTDIITQTNPNEIKTNKIPNTVNAVVDPQDLNKFAKKYLGYAWIFLFILFLILTYAYRIIQALIYALIGKIFNALTGAQLSYGQVLQVAMVAVTPVIVLATIFDIFDVKFAHKGLFFFVLAMLYLFYGVIANKSNTK